MKLRRLQSLIALMAPVVMFVGYMAVTAVREEHRVPATFERDAAGGYQA